MRSDKATRGFYVPAEQAQHYAAAGFEIVDDLTPDKVLAIPRGDQSAPTKEARDGPG